MSDIVSWWMCALLIAVHVILCITMLTIWLSRVASESWLKIVYSHEKATTDAQVFAVLHSMLAIPYWICFGIDYFVIPMMGEDASTLASLFFLGVGLAMLVTACGVFASLKNQESATTLMTVSMKWLSRSLLYVVYGGLFFGFVYGAESIAFKLAFISSLLIGLLVFTLVVYFSYKEGRKVPYDC